MTWLVAALLSAFSLTAVAVEPATAAPSIDVRSRAIPLDAANWDTEVVGRLRYRGGVHLTSADRRFGGLSGLMVSADGTEFTAVSDGGAWTLGELTYDADGMLSGVSNVRIEPIRDTDGKALTGRRGDAEALAPGPEGGRVVAFERDPKLHIYRDGEELPQLISAPAGIERAPPNRGMEAVTRLAGGELLVVTEYDERPGRFVGWIGGSGGWSRVTYLSDQGYRPTGAATLPNGDVVFVDRRFPLLSIRVRRAAAAVLKPGAEIEADVLARLEGSKSFDNMEGIDARVGANGETLIYLVSDDNFQSLQRTLLMMFELQGDRHEPG